MSCCETDLLECCYLGISPKGAENRVEDNVQGWTSRRALSRHFPNHSRHHSCNRLSSVESGDFHICNFSCAFLYHCLWALGIEEMGSLARDSTVLSAACLRCRHIEFLLGELFSLPGINFHDARHRLSRIHNSVIHSLRVRGSKKKHPSIIRLAKRASGLSRTSAFFQL